MMGYPPTAWQIGSVQAGQVPVILNLLILKVRNMDIKTWPSFITDAPSTVFSARIGLTEKESGRRKG
jgi:hypothetical protein